MRAVQGRSPEGICNCNRMSFQVPTFGGLNAPSFRHAASLWECCAETRQQVVAAPPLLELPACVRELLMFVLLHEKH